MSKPKPVVKKDGLQRLALLSALDKVRVAVDTKGVSGMEQAQYFIIHDDRITAYNDRISISASVGMNTKLKLMAHASDLFKVLSDIPEEVIKMSFDDGELVVSSATTTAWMASLPLEGELLELVKSLKLESLKEKDWQDLPENFIDAINLCMFSVSRDVADVVYSSISVDHDGMSTGTVCSTDTRRISQYQLGAGAVMNFLLPSAVAKMLVKYQVVHVQQMESWVHFRDVDGLVFSGRIVDADFPNTDEYFKFKGETVDLPLELVHALKQSLVFAFGDDADTQQAKITFQKGKVVVDAENDRGRIKREVSVPGFKAPAMATTLLINPIFFIDILQRATKMKVGEGRALFSMDNYQLVMKLPVDENEDS